MVSKFLALGALGAASVSVLAGVFLFSTIPKELGFYRWLTTLHPFLVGLMPMFHYGIPWKYTWEEFYKEVDFSGQRAIVTGANSGIGLDTAMALAKVGASVTMVCRTPSKCEAARNQIIQEVGSTANVETMTMDTSSLASVRAFAEAYMKEHGPKEPIDMLFMNAGSNFMPAPGESTKCSPKTKDGIEKLFQVNYLGHHLMYRLLEPLIVKSKQARIIQTSSASSFLPYKKYKVATDLETLHGCSEPYVDFWTNHNSSYGQSKLAQILWVKALTRMLPKDSNVYPNAYHPGAVDTPIIGKMLDSSKAGGGMRNFMSSTMTEAWKSPDGALTGLYLGVNPKKVRGKYYHPQAQEVVNPMSLDEKLQDDLWNFSEDLVRDYLSPIELPEPEANGSEGIEEEQVDEEQTELPEEESDEVKQEEVEEEEVVEEESIAEEEPVVGSEEAPTQAEEEPKETSKEESPAQTLDTEAPAVEAEQEDVPPEEEGGEAPPLPEEPAEPEAQAEI